MTRGTHRRSPIRPKPRPVHPRTVTLDIILESRRGTRARDGVIVPYSGCVASRRFRLASLPNDYVWRFVGGRPVVNRWEHMKQLPARTAESDALSGDLNKRDFRHRPLAKRT